jgi:Sulfotransferase domain
MEAPKRATSVPELFEKIRKFRTPEGEARGLAYKPARNDIFILTPPKCGTTWMQQIVHGIQTRGSMNFDEITRVIPWLEMAEELGIDIHLPQAAPKTFKTHLTLERVPKGGKYISVVRDPMDAMLSHYRFFEGWLFEKDSISIEEFALKFYIERPGENSYWRHVISIWERRAEKNILPLCFENIKMDLAGTIERVADFIEVDLNNESKEIVLMQSNIEFMKAHNDKFDDHIVRSSPNHMLNIPADGATSKVKTGKVGESRKFVSTETRDLFDQIWQEEITARTGLNSYQDLRQKLLI